MLDALKFAFEILIVGTLALPWLAILNRMIDSGAISSVPSYLSVLPRSARSTVAVAVVIAFGYVAGSAISRASRDLFNDELLRPIPTEARIRDAVYQNEYCGQELIYMDENLPLFNEPSSSDKSSVSTAHKQKLIHQKYKTAFCPGKETPEQLDSHIQEMFSLQEGELLLLGQDKVDRLKQYYDQITVLRGAALNGFILCVVCAFGYFGTLRTRWSERGNLRFLAFLPSVLLLLYGTYGLWGHFNDLSLRAHELYPTKDPTLAEVLEGLYSDPPFAELVIILLSTVGFFANPKVEHAASYIRTCAVAAGVSLVCFGGWWWTEVMYDLQVVHSQIELHPATAAATAAPAAVPISPPNLSKDQNK